MDVLILTLQVLAGAVGLAGAAVMFAGMWRESRLLGAATGAVCVMVLAGLLVAGGGLAGANEIVLGG